MSTIAPPELPDVEARVRRLREPIFEEWRRPRRAPARRRPLALASVAAALAAAVALSPGWLSDDAAPALAVEREDGWLVLHVSDTAAGEEVLTRQLRDAGIPGEVRLLPVRDEDVGTWAVISERADPPGTPRTIPPADRSGGPATGPEETVRLDRVRYERETLRIPIAEVRESTGYFVFYAGREARPGEELWRDGDRRFPR